MSFFATFAAVANLGLALALLFPPPALAEENPSTAPPPAPAVAESAPAPASPTPPAEELPLLLVGARVDAAFAAGDPAVQGFSIPSVRLTAFGYASSHISYRLSLGQTREFSSLLIPQLLPVEAFVRLQSVPGAQVRRRSYASLTVGMFTPSLNPWWTPDLTDVLMPDYHVTHRAMLPSRDVGAELSIVPVPDRLEIVVGAFNGVGIVGLNTNNAKAFTGFVRSAFPAGEARVFLGVGGYWMTQAAPGVANYRRNWTLNPFGALEVIPLATRVQVEGIYGSVEDNLTSAKPSGAAVVVTIGPDWAKGFLRYESLKAAPTASGTLKQFQIGPVISPHPSLQLWMLFQSLDGGTGISESSGLFRLRLAI